MDAHQALYMRIIVTRIPSSSMAATPEPLSSSPPVLGTVSQ